MEPATLAATALTLALLAGTLWGAGLWARSGFRPHVAAGTSFALLLVPRIPLLWDHTPGLMAAMLTVLLMGTPAILMTLQAAGKRR